MDRLFWKWEKEEAGEESSQKEKIRYAWDYREVFLLSRRKDKDDYIPCEMCYQSPIVDIHHIHSSYRWERIHNPDGSDIIGVCRNCHILVHNNNSTYQKRKLLKMVDRILDDINQ
jgi:Zn-finger protein